MKLTVLIINVLNVGFDVGICVFMVVEFSFEVDFTEFYQYLWKFIIALPILS